MINAVCTTCLYKNQVFNVIREIGRLDGWYSEHRVSQWCMLLLNTQVLASHMLHVTVNHVNITQLQLPSVQHIQKYLHTLTLDKKVTKLLVQSEASLVFGCHAVSMVSYGDKLVF